MMKETTLAEILSEPTRNGLTKPKAIRGKGVPMIAMGEIFAHSRISDIEMERVPVTEKELNTSFIRECDILFARQSLTLEGAGKCSIVVKVTEPTVFESHLIRIRVNPEIADPYYVYYYFNSHEGKKRVKSIVEQVAAAGIRGSDLVKLKISLPEIDQQHKIAVLLMKLDEAREVNEKINENLEQQAAAYFYHQFIVNANPSWKEGTISDLGTVIGGSTPSKSKPEYYTDNGIAWITPKDLSVDKSKFISHGADDITELGLRNSSASIMPAGTVLFSSRAPIGYIAIADGEVTTNQGFKSVVPRSNVGTAFVYYFLKNALPTIENMASGSTFKEISGSAMRTVPAIIPDDESLQEFSDICEPLFQQQRILEAENRSLAALRDSLLPRLMSGELDVTALDL